MARLQHAHGVLTVSDDFAAKHDAHALWRGFCAWWSGIVPHLREGEAEKRQEEKKGREEKQSEEGRREDKMEEKRGEEKRRGREPMMVTLSAPLQTTTEVRINGRTDSWPGPGGTRRRSMLWVLRWIVTCDVKDNERMARKVCSAAKVRKLQWHCGKTISSNHACF